RALRPAESPLKLRIRAHGPQCWIPAAASLRRRRSRYMGVRNDVRLSVSWTWPATIDQDDCAIAPDWDRRGIRSLSPMQEHSRCDPALAMLSQEFFSITAQSPS